MIRVSLFFNSGVVRLEGRSMGTFQSWVINYKSLAEAVINTNDCINERNL